MRNVGADDIAAKKDALLRSRVAIRVEVRRKDSHQVGGSASLKVGPSSDLHLVIS